MLLFLIRHGESEADLLNVHEGRADFSLTERGVRQAEKMALWAAEYVRPEIIYSSTLKRASQTAQILAGKACAVVEYDEMLAEFNNGLLAGLDREEAARRYPRIENLPVHESRYEMESRLEFRFRAEYVLSRLREEAGKYGRIAAVTHGGMINELYGALLNLPVKSGASFPTSDTGIHCWDIGRDSVRVIYANSTQHLA